MCSIRDSPLPSPPPTQAGTLHLPIGGGNTVLGRAHCTAHCTLHTAYCILHCTLHCTLHTALQCARRGGWTGFVWPELYCTVVYCTVLEGLHPDSVVIRLAGGEQLGPEWCTTWVYTLGWEGYIGVLWLTALNVRDLNGAKVRWVMSEVESSQMANC